MLHSQGVVGADTNSLSDSVAMPRAPLKGLENEEIKCALHERNAIFSWFRHAYGRFAMVGHLPKRVYHSFGNVENAGFVLLC